MTPEELVDYAKKIKKYDKKSGIVILAPDEFGNDEENYETVSLTYYADNVLCNELDEVIPDPENYIGDALDHFGEWEPDAVYVRNEDLGMEYEILRDERPFAEVSQDLPKPVEIRHGDEE